MDAPAESSPLGWLGIACWCAVFEKKVRPRQVVESARAELPYQVGSTPPWGNSIFKIDLFPDHRILAEMQRN